MRMHADGAIDVLVGGCQREGAPAGIYIRPDVNKAIYAEIDKLEKTEKEIKKYSQHREIFAWLAAPGLLLVLLETALGHTVWRKLP